MSFKIGDKVRRIDNKRYTNGPITGKRYTILKCFCGGAYVQISDPGIWRKDRFVLSPDVLSKELFQL